MASSDYLFSLIFRILTSKKWSKSLKDFTLIYGFIFDKWYRFASSIFLFNLTFSSGSGARLFAGKINLSTASGSGAGYTYTIAGNVVTIAISLGSGFNGSVMALVEYTDRTTLWPYDNAPILTVTPVVVVVPK